MRDPNQLVISEPLRSPRRHPGRPEFRGKVPIPTQEKPSPEQYIVIQIDFTEDEYGGIEALPPRYYKLKPGSLAPARHMDVNLVELGE